MQYLPAVGSAPVFSRRSVLRATGAISLAALVTGGSSFTSAAGTARAPSPTPGTVPSPGVAVPVPPPPTPYTIQASCELSEDYFLTDQVVVDENDRVLPFTTPGGTVEAVVLSGGAVSHLRRDPAQTSGWAFTAISATQSLFAQGPITDAAVQTNSEGFTVLACVQSVYSGPGLAFYTVDSAGNWSSIPDTTITLAEAPANQLKAQLAPAGLIYFYLFDDDGTFDVYALPDASSGLEVLPIDSLQGLSVADAILLWNPGQQPNQPPNGSAAVILDPNGNLNSYPQTDFDDFDLDSATELAPQYGGSVADLIWAAAEQGQAQPDVVFQTSDGALYYSAADGESLAVAVDYGDTPGPGRAAVWREEDLYSFSFLDTNGLVNILAQYHDTPTSTQFTDPIPLQGGIHAIYGQPSDPTQATLFVVDVGLALNVLAKDATGVWSYLPIHQDGATLQQVTSWRVQLLVQDANTTPIGGAQVRLSADQTIGCWQSTGNTMLGSAPVTLTADPTGRITFSIPTSELDTATLTAQALDADGQPTGGPASIDPDTDAHHFLAGGSSLTDIGMLSSTALLGAQNADGTPLLPGLTNLPSGQLQAAQAVVGALQHTAALGLGSTPQSATDPRSAILDFTGNSGPTFQTSTDPNAYTSLMAVEGISDWWDKAKNDAESVYHAIRHAAATVTKMVTTWSDDVKKWTVNLFVDLGDGIQNLVNYVVNTMHDAIHAISSFFHSLGSDIVKTWEWLKHHVLQLLKKAEANAKVIEGWLGQAGAEYGEIIDSIQTFTDNFFTGLETTAHEKISYLAGLFEHQTFGQAVPLPAPDSNSGSNDTDTILKDITEAGKVMHYVSGSWLWDKLQSYLPHSPDTQPAPSADADVVLRDLVTVLVDQLTAIEDVGKLLETCLEDLATSKQSFTETEIAELFTQLDQVIHDVLVLADALADTVLEMLRVGFESITNILDYEMQDVPLIGELLKLADIDPTLSIKHLMALITAFPATLYYGVISDAPLFPTTTGAAADAPPVAGGPVDPWGAGLGWAAFAVQTVWFYVDSVEDLKQGDDPRGNPSWWNYVDIACPLLLSILQWPGTPIDGKTAPPYSPLPLTGPDGGLVYPMITLGVLPAICDALQTCASNLKNYDPDETVAVYFQPVVQTVSGIGSIVLGSLWNWANDQNTNSKAIGVMSGLSYVTAPLGTQVVGDASEGVSYIVKDVIDAVGNFGTAIAISINSCTLSGL